MRKKSETKNNRQAPWVHLPSQHFERWKHSEEMKISSSINQQIMDFMYDRWHFKKKSDIWILFERLLNSIFQDLRTIIDDETSIIGKGTLHALQPKWLILREMIESIKTLGYSYCHIFADKADLLLFYAQQAETLVGEVLEYISLNYDGNHAIASSETSEANVINIENETMERVFTALVNTDLLDGNIEDCNTFLASLEELSSQLRDCVYAQTYYLFKNTISLYHNVEIFQQHNSGIYNSRRMVFLNDYNNSLKKIARREDVSNPEMNPKLREKAFTDTMLKSYSETYQLYESHRGMLESLNNCESYTEDDLPRTFFKDLFLTHYKGEQRDAEGNLTEVFVDVKRNTSVEGKSGWERWLDLLTVISLIREYEQKKQPTTSNATKHKKIKTFQEFIKDATRTEEIIKKMHHLIGNKQNGRALKIITRAWWIEWLDDKPSASSIRAEFKSITCRDQYISKCLKEPKPTKNGKVDEEEIERIRQEYETA